MLNQNFTTKTFLRLTTKKDIIRFKLGKQDSDYEKKLGETARLLTASPYNFLDIKRKKIGKNVVTTSRSIAGTYALRHIARLLTRLYKVKQGNRNLISNQVARLLEENSNYWIIKADIRRFFESIPRDKLTRTLLKDRLLSPSIRETISNLFKSVHLADKNGLPRGISISSPLSELYIRKFDRIVRAMPEVYYYARYVDDFIIFCHRDPSLVSSKISAALNELGLEINNKKKQTLSMKSLSEKADVLSFLGYQFIVRKTPEKNDVHIRISSNRARKIKTRIVLSLLDYAKNSDVELFKDRMRFLAGNYVLKTRKNEDFRPLMGGFYFNNSLVNDHEQIRSFDKFLMSQLTARKGSIFRHVGGPRLENAKEHLKGTSFEKGFAHRIEYDFSIARISKIKSCWKTEFLHEKDYAEK